jgi:hypothetical protein
LAIQATWAGTGGRSSHWLAPLPGFMDLPDKFEDPQRKCFQIKEKKPKNLPVQTPKNRIHNNNDDDDDDDKYS